MRTYLYLAALLPLTWLLLVAASPRPAPEPIRLPIEVLGADGYVATVHFTVEDAANIDYLRLTLHRPAYRDALVNPERGAKASLRLNDGSWIDLTNATTEVEPPGADYGGLGGGFYTVSLRVPVDKVRAGENTLRFRFNGTDGFTSGYRVLELNLLRGGAAPVLSESTFTEDDPATWTAPLNNAADIDRGRALWYGAQLAESPLSDRLLIAGCSDCHAQDGRDLQYFNYSNRSIQERSKFHGLSDREGKQIASYIRSLNGVPYAVKGRPWNPPYQPGPNLDGQPVSQWAAGAGLKAVLDHDREMLPYLYPQGTSQVSIDQRIDITQTVNVREMPVPLQLPDWNAWLPDGHPVDIFGSHFTEDAASREYADLRTYLSSRTSATDGIEDGRLLADLNGFRDRTNRFIRFMNGPQPCRRYYSSTTEELTGNIDRRRSGTDCEQALLSLNQWSAVKSWEVMQEFRLEELTEEIYPRGEVRGWPGRWRQVFEVAAHRSANNSTHFEYQTRALGAVQSATWYHLQMVLNAGNRDPHTWFPQDWFYTPAYIANTALFNEVDMGNMITLSQLKMYQNLDVRGPDGEPTADTPNGKDWWLPFITPWRFESVQSSVYTRGIPWSHLDTYEEGLRARVTNAFLRQFLDKMKTYPVDKLPREEQEGDDGAAYDNVNTVPEPYREGDHNYYSPPGNAEHATAIYRTIPRFNALGVDADLMNEYIDWCKAVWPKGNWDELRPSQALNAPTDVVAGVLGNEEGDLTGIQVFPNPARDRVTISGPADYSVALYDMRGSAVRRTAGQTGQEEIDLTGLPAGVYVLEITATDTRQRYRERLVVR